MIDAHQHFWDIARADCRWPTPELSAIYKSFDMQDYRQQAKPATFRGSVLVQSQACDSDTDYLLALAKEQDEILAVVGWVDLEAENAAERIRLLAEQKKLRGLRPMLQAIADNNWVNRESLKPAFHAMQEQHLSFDALIQPRHLKALVVLAENQPGLPIVINHAAKPDIASGEFVLWADGIKRLSECENVFCKLSGLVTEAKPSQLSDFENLKPYVQHIIHCFGAEKVMWGSDWPVVNLASNWQEWYTESRKLLSALNQGEIVQTEIFEGCARRFYRL